MSVIAQLCAVFAICLICEGISAILPFAFPGTVLSMVVLLILFVAKVLKPRQLQQTADFLLPNMTMFFIPVCTGIMTYADVLFANFWAIVLISLLTTPLVFFVTGHVVQLTMKWIRRREAQHHG